MRALVWFLAAIAIALLLATGLAYPAYEWIHPWVPAWRIDRIASRLFDLILLGLLFAVVRHLKLKGGAAWGWPAHPGDASRPYRRGVLAGVLTMLPVSATMILLGVRPLAASLGPMQVLHALLAGIGSGLVVGLLEETLFRGLIYGAVAAHSRRAITPVISVALLFAAVHFLASVHIEHDAVNAQSGWLLLQGTLAEFSHPARMADAFLALFGVGVLSGVARHWAGDVRFAAGLHGGWVLVMRATIGCTVLNSAGAYRWLLSAHDGYTGWLVAAFTAGFGLLAWRCRTSLCRWVRGD